MNRILVAEDEYVRYLRNKLGGQWLEILRGRGRRLVEVA